MRFSSLLLPAVMFAFSSCASQKLEYPVTEKKYQNDLVSVQAALNLAYSAYLKGCADRSLSFGEKTFFKFCSEKAREHVKENIVFILDEEVKTKANP